MNCRAGSGGERKIHGAQKETPAAQESWGALRGTRGAKSLLEGDAVQAVVDGVIVSLGMHFLHILFWKWSVAVWPPELSRPASALRLGAAPLICSVSAAWEFRGSGWASERCCLWGVRAGGRPVVPGSRLPRSPPEPASGQSDADSAFSPDPAPHRDSSQVHLRQAHSGQAGEILHEEWRWLRAHLRPP